MLRIGQVIGSGFCRPRLGAVLLRPGCGQLIAVRARGLTSAAEADDDTVVRTISDFKPSYRHVVEMFLDEFVKGKEPMHRGMGWYCMPAKEEEEEETLFHWRDKEQYTENSIVRVEMIPLGDKLKRFVEIHFNHRFMLIHQHDLSRPEDVPEDERKKLAMARKVLNEHLLPERSTLEQTEQMVHFNDVGVDRSYSTYTGIDIPSNWLLAMKSQKWPAMHKPDYLSKVEYFEFFRNSPLLDSVREKYVHGDDANYPYWWDLYESLVLPDQKTLHPSTPRPPKPPGHINMEEIKPFLLE